MERTPNRLFEAIYESKTVIIGMMLIFMALGVIVGNHVQKLAIEPHENIAYVTEFFTFTAGIYTVIAGARAGVNYVNIKKEEITAIRENTATVTQRPTPPVR